MSLNPAYVIPPALMQAVGVTLSPARILPSLSPRSSIPAPEKQASKKSLIQIHDLAVTHNQSLTWRRGGLYCLSILIFILQCSKDVPGQRVSSRGSPTSSPTTPHYCLILLLASHVWYCKHTTDSHRHLQLHVLLAEGCYQSTETLKNLSVLSRLPYLQQQLAVCHFVLTLRHGAR